MRCWKRSLLGKPQRFHRCTRSLNAVCKCKMCTTAFSMDGQRWFRCRWWSVGSPLHPRRHRHRCLMRGHLHPPPWMWIWRHHRHHRPLRRQLLVVHQLRRRQWSSEPSLPVVGSPLASSMLHVDALSSLAIAQMGWPRLPPPTGGPNGPRSGRHVGRLGGRGWRVARQASARAPHCAEGQRGADADKPRRGRALRSRADALRGTRLARRRLRRSPWRVARARYGPQHGRTRRGLLRCSAWATMAARRGRLPGGATGAQERSPGDSAHQALGPAPTERRRRRAALAGAVEPGWMALARGCWATAMAAGSFMLPGGALNDATRGRLSWRRPKRKKIPGRALA
jgi:hypothetical protein